MNYFFINFNIKKNHGKKGYLKQLSSGTLN